MQPAGPSQDPLVRGDQSMASDDGGGRDETIGGVAVKPAEAGRTSCNLSIYRDFDKTLTQKEAAPLIYLEIKLDPPLLPQQTHFPERDGRNRAFVRLESPIDLPPRPSPHPLATGPKPEQDMGVEQGHGFSTRSGSISASHSASSGSTTSPRIRSLP